MTINEILTDIDDRGFADVSAARKLNIINDVVWDICGREPWPFLEKSISLTFSGSSGVPSNYPTDVGSVLSLVDSGSGTRLYPIRREEFLENHATILTTTGSPYFYYFLAGVLQVFPIPPSTENILMSYTAIQSKLTVSSLEADILIPLRFHSIITFGVLVQLFEMNDLEIQANKYENKFERKFQTMRNQIWQRQLDKSDTIEISDSEDLYN